LSPLLAFLFFIVILLHRLGAGTAIRQLANAGPS
jgi:hypothetical protein